MSDQIRTPGPGWRNLVVGNGTKAQTITLKMPSRTVEITLEEAEYLCRNNKAELIANDSPGGIFEALAAYDKSIPRAAVNLDTA